MKTEDIKEIKKYILKYTILNAELEEITKKLEILKTQFDEKEHELIELRKFEKIFIQQLKDKYGVEINAEKIFKMLNGK